MNDESPTGPLEPVVGRHTPGPWHVAESGFSRRGLWSAPTVYATDDELRYVAVCACADELNFHRATDNLANARLIAAAPELLELAEALKAAIDGDHITNTTHEDSTGVLLDFVNLALAKATGVPPNAALSSGGTEEQQETADASPPSA